ncbi:hypothetical protein F511_23498 [Dorcoceras hygrometricum]|uniref:Uncharacterized protein n=1 Tax=Dorcoceras hygrometricum TaxID=472368 RepID=A0A2Z7AEN6_9LAMI|nr:hypothetical protein F511_23498 [Dorcoceras hygrometricum]
MVAKKPSREMRVRYFRSPSHPGKKQQQYNEIQSNGCNRNMNAICDLTKRRRKAYVILSVNSWLTKTSDWIPHSTQNIFAAGANTPAADFLALIKTKAPLLIQTTAYCTSLQELVANRYHPVDASQNVTVLKSLALFAESTGTAATGAQMSSPPVGVNSSADDRMMGKAEMMKSLKEKRAKAEGSLSTGKGKRKESSTEQRITNDIRVLKAVGVHFLQSSMDEILSRHEQLMGQFEELHSQRDEEKKQLLFELEDTRAQVQSSESPGSAIEKERRPPSFLSTASMAA